MHIPISPRLLACARLVSQGERVADVGCDHGYLGIYLLKNGIASSVIASDIRKGPLEAAIRNAKKFGVNQDISFHLSDGVTQVPRDFDTFVCAGMGGDTMVSILEAAPWLKNKQYRLILQCQSKNHVLRKYLLENGWNIRAEHILRDGRFLYTVMEIGYEEVNASLSWGEYYFPGVLQNNPADVLAEYYRRTVKKLEISVIGHKDQADPREVEALHYLQNLTIHKEELL